MTFAAMPNLIYQACLASGMPSNTVYIQHAVCEALSKDLDIDLSELLEQLPNPRGNAKRLHAGPGNTVEDVT